MNENKTDTPAEPPKLNQVLWKIAVKTIGLKGALIIFIVIGLVAAGLEFIPKIIDQYSILSDSYKRNFPKVPEFKPTDFTIGVYIAFNNKPDSSLYNELQLTFYGIPDLHFHPITTFSPKFSSTLPDNPEANEEVIQNWISTTGANGVIWGVERIVGADTLFFLNWTNPEVSDMSSDGTIDILDKHTLRFPALNKKQAFLLSTVYTAVLFKQNNQALDRPDILIPSTDHEEDNDQRQLYSGTCSHLSTGYNCQFLNRIKLDMFLRDANTLGDFVKEDWGPIDNDSIRDLRYLEMQIQQLWDVHPVDLNNPIAPNTTAEFQDYSLMLKFLSYMAENNLKYADRYFDYAKQWSSIPAYQFGLAVQQSYPFFEQYEKMMNARVSILYCIYKTNFEYRPNKDKWPLDEWQQQLGRFEKAVNTLATSDLLNDFQKGAMMNEVAVVAAKLAIFQREKRKPWDITIDQAERYFTLALQKLDWFEHRTPLYIGGIRVSYANALLIDTASNSSLHVLRTAEDELDKAIGIARKQASYTLLKAALENYAELYSKQAVLSGSLDLHHKAIQSWVDAQRASPNITMDVEEDTLFRYVVRNFYKSSPKKEFDNYLKQQNFDLGKIYAELIQTK